MRITWAKSPIPPRSALARCRAGRSNVANATDAGGHSGTDSTTPTLVADRGAGASAADQPGVGEHMGEMERGDLVAAVGEAAPAARRARPATDSGAESARGRGVGGMRHSVRFPALMGCRFLAGLAPAEQAALLDACQLRHFTRAEEILVQGEASPGMYIIAQGAIEISVVGLDGHRSIIHHAGAGEVLGEAEAVAGNACVATCIAPAGSSVLLCPTPMLMAQLSHPLLLRNFAATFCQRMQRDNAFKLVDQFQPVEQRVCSYLRQLSMRSAVLQQNQAYLANVVGCSRQTINRILGSLRDEGIIALGKSEIRILDPEALEQRAGNAGPA